MSRKLTTEEFIQKARLIHGNKYDYSKVVYINAITKIIIICPIHGEFLVTPNAHLTKKSGCPICANNIKYTKKSLQEKSNKIHNNEYEILEEPINSGTPVKILHKKCGYTFNQTPSTHNKSGCPRCAKNIKYTKESLQERSNIVHNNEYLILEEPIKAIIPVLIQHTTCGHIFKQQPQHHINNKSGCPKCSAIKMSIKMKMTKEELQQRSNLVHNNEYIILGEYKGSNTDISILHKKCNNIFNQTPNHHINSGSGCPKCAAIKIGDYSRLSREDIQNRSNLIHNNEYEILEDPINTKTPILIKHKKCNKSFKQIPQNHMNGAKCVFCSMSNGEIFIEKYMRINNIEFIPQYSFNDCKYIHKLNFDFYIPNKNICIEFDGEQHFNIINHSSDPDKNIKRLQDIKLRDSIKNKYCEDNNIKLIRIPYWDIKKIPEILDKELKHD